MAYALQLLALPSRKKPFAPQVAIQALCPENGRQARANRRNAIENVPRMEINATTLLVQIDSELIKAPWEFLERSCRNTDEIEDTQSFAEGQWCTETPLCARGIMTPSRNSNAVLLLC